MRGAGRRPLTFKPLPFRFQIEDHNLVSFLPLDPTNDSSIATVLSHIDNSVQYGEAEEVKMPGKSSIISRIDAAFVRLPTRELTRSLLAFAADMDEGDFGDEE